MMNIHDSFFVKKTVSIEKNVHVSQRLILCNLKELYTAFKDKHPDLKISFSKFASLRPKWCITVGPKGTHSVCVCTAHQNVKLLLSSVNLSKDYHELLELIVCDRNSKECMIHRCESCPGVNAVKKFIEGELMKADDDDGQVDDYDDVEITFQQWTTSDRAELISCTLPLDEFIEQLCEQLDEITSHSFIARSQSQYLNKLKENLKCGEVIILGDFAENFSFIVQDEIQGYLWNKQQCSLHPIVLYYCKENESDLVSTSICFLFDDVKHDVNFVYQIMKDTIKYICDNITEALSKVHYFSDGCAGQYKNCKNFLDLCFHNSDF